MIKKLNADAMRRATDGARPVNGEAARDLVQRTLAQHGLVSPLANEGGFGGLPDMGGLPGMGKLSDMGSLPDMNALMGGLAGRNTAPDAPLVEGAVFRRSDATEGGRAFRTYVPATATDGVAGIVVMLHGCTQTPEDFARGTGMNDLAEKHRLVVIYPQQSRGDNAQSCWNWFSRGDQRRERGEPAILAAITRDAMAEFGVSRERTFVAGLSAGAAMAVILGATYPDVFSAVGAHSGLPLGAANDVASAFAAMAGNGAVVTPSGAAHPGAGTVRTIVFHGTADATVHPTNGEAIARQALDRGARQTIETEVRGDVGGRAFHRRIAASPDGAADLEHWVIDGLGHAWSGGKPAGTYTDAKGPDASAEMVRFFLNEKEL
ncbi:alpha/beta hydrolase family esterase [Oceaniglobus indicus]|uniref:extracellular catalytic domain type 1 short-chain-length polyhydroxyalkanoate depolymerase n=1 Tax=Oceaniglobus indicus TaxID=2047749 RepID=UPI000C17FD6E|nr:PHB depolymerase family esterase [Oceaniglobus indicus]